VKIGDHATTNDAKAVGHSDIIHKTIVECNNDRGTSAANSRAS
jgi:hypothetical protein